MLSIKILFCALIEDRMKIKGKYKINATTDVVWANILNPRILERTVPGIKKLEEKEEADTYVAISEVKIGPVRGVFEGDLYIKDKVEGESCTVVLDQKSKMGNVIAEIAVKMIANEDGSTEVEYEGSPRISGMLARMGQRIIGGVVTTLAKQFFTALEKDIENQ